MKIVVVRQPWAWLIVKGLKDVENRSWATSHRGPLLISASSRTTKREMAEARQFAFDRGIVIPRTHELQYGGVIGRVTLVDCVRHSESRWFVGPVGWLLRDAVELPFTPIAGTLGVFDAPSDIFPVDDSELPVI